MACREGGAEGGREEEGEGRERGGREREDRGSIFIPTSGLCYGLVLA